MRTRASAVGDIYRVGKAAQRQRFVKEIGALAGNRRRDFRGGDKAALAKRALKFVGDNRFA
jgi:hypothetical protein